MIIATMKWAEIAEHGSPVCPKVAAKHLSQKLRGRGMHQGGTVARPALLHS